jgi:hypothetical protein
MSNRNPRTVLDRMFSTVLLRLSNFLFFILLCIFRRVIGAMALGDGYGKLWDSIIASGITLGIPQDHGHLGR